MADPAPLVADADRDATVARLRTACADGRLSLDEFADRVGDAWAARTGTDLAAVVADLPAPSTRPVRRRVVAVAGMARLRGRWRPARDVRVVAVAGGAEVDLVDAVLDGPDLRLRVVAVLGGVEVVVPEGVAVELGGVAVLGARTWRVRPSAPAAGGPVVEVRAVAVLGGVTVRTPHPRPG
ncbi:MAG TPA: DUF1707 domain-containing protein [Acidimicrobiales bacterium]|jgi:hypothetical protein